MAQGLEESESSMLHYEILAISFPCSHPSLSILVGAGIMSVSGELMELDFIVMTSNDYRIVNSQSQRIVCSEV